MVKLKLNIRFQQLDMYKIMMIKQSAPQSASRLQHSASTVQTHLMIRLGASQSVSQSVFMSLSLLETMRSSTKLLSTL